MSSYFGPAYPALLVFGMPVMVTPKYGDAYRAIYMEHTPIEQGGDHYVASPDTRGGQHKYAIVIGYRSVGASDVILLDYADTDVQDRIARKRFGVPWDRVVIAGCIESERDELEDDDPGHAVLDRVADVLWSGDDAQACRALAAAVWGDAR